jgi:hypothetical protein
MSVCFGWGAVVCEGMSVINFVSMKNTLLESLKILKSLK